MMNQMNDRYEYLIKKYKNNITPNSMTGEEFLALIENHYNCTDITDSCKNSVDYIMFEENLKNYMYERSIELNKPNIIVLKVNNNKNRKDNTTIILEVNTKAFSCNNDVVTYKLKMLRSVSQEAYDNNTQDLMELLSYMHVYKTSSLKEFSCQKKY